MKRILMATLLIALVMAPIGIASGANKQIQFPSWMWGEAGTGDWFKDGVALYESQNPGVKVAPALVPAGQYEEKLLIDMAGGGAPDLAPVFTNMMPKLMRMGLLEPLDDYLASSEHLSPLVEVADILKVDFRKNDDEEKRSIAERVRTSEIRARLLAEKVETKKSYISRLENGNCDIQLSILYRIFEEGLGKRSVLL